MAKREELTAEALGLVNELARSIAPDALDNAVDLADMIEELARQRLHRTAVGEIEKWIETLKEKRLS